MTKTFIYYRKQKYIDMEYYFKKSVCAFNGFDVFRVISLEFIINESLN